MFDEHPRTPAPISFTPAVITLVVGCAGFTISLGLCGLGIGLASRGNQKGNVLMPFALVLFGVSILALLVSIVWLIIVAIVNASRNSQGGGPPVPPASY